MSEWMAWFVVGGLVVVIELFVGTFYLLMIGLGMAVGGVAALLGLSLPLQAICAALAGSIATLLLRRSRYGRRPAVAPQSDPDMNMDIGQTLTVAEWQDGRARVMYRGAMWDVALAPDALAAPGVFIIREIQGSCLIVA